MTEPEPLKQPRLQLGNKIEVSKYRDKIATMLLMKKGYAPILRYMDEMDFHTDLLVLKGFETNYVSKLSQEARERLTAVEMTARKERNEKIVSQAVHATLSRVESIITLIEHTEDQITLMEMNPRMSPFERDVLGKYYDKLLYYRTQLERSRTDSEVEIERTKAIKQVAEVAISWMKDRPDVVNTFIKQIIAIRDRQPDPLKAS